jgi:hypothetical protein
MLEAKASEVVPVEGGIVEEGAVGGEMVLIGGDEVVVVVGGNAAEIEVGTEVVVALGG